MSDHLGDIFTFYPRDLPKGRSAQTRVLPGPRLAGVPASEQDNSPLTCHTLCAVPLSPRSSSRSGAITAGLTPWKGTPSLCIQEVRCSEPVRVRGWVWGWGWRGCAEGPLGGITAGRYQRLLGGHGRSSDSALNTREAGKGLRQERDLCSRKIL